MCCIRNEVCDETDINLVCVSENWLKQYQIELFEPGNFTPANVVCRNGGVGVLYSLSLMSHSSMWS